MPKPRDGEAQHELVRRLQQAMTSLGWSRATLAEKAEVSKATISNVFTFKTVPTRTTLDQLLDALRIAGSQWKELHALREQADSRAQRLDHYLAAAEGAVRDHPYAGALPGIVPPLATVYVRQLARQEDPAGGDGASETHVGTVAGPRPADQLLSRAETCVVAGPGGGKSSLLRTYLADVVRGWRAGSAGPVLAVLAPASALLGMPLAEALARHANADLAGLVERLPVELFAKRPYPRARWLVLVDGLDEITDPQARHRVLRTISAVTNGLQADQYRFVVATRPLPRAELDLLGRDTPHFQLEPLSRDDLRHVARAWFQAMDLPAPAAMASRFLTAVDNANLAELACVPLMATMLCQLQAHAPQQAVPTTRGAVYNKFTALLHKRQYAPGARDILRADLDGYGPGVTARAEDTLEHLPELIGHLATVRLTGDTRPTLDILRNHPHAHRPARVPDDEWDDFLTAALCRSGLITRSASDFAFLHQTLLEHQAARHATRDAQARAQTLGELFRPTAGRWGEPRSLRRENSSYAGFVLHGLLTPQDHIAEQTAKALTELGSQRDWMVCEFLTRQVHLRTAFPSGVADRLTQFANDSGLADHSRVNAAHALTEMEGHREAGPNQLAALADNPNLHTSARVNAAKALSGVEGHRTAGADRLIDFADDPDFDDNGARVNAARALAEVEGYREAGVERLIDLIDNPNLHASTRVNAARILAGVEGHRTAGADRLTALADNPDLYPSTRVDAAKALSGVEGHRTAGADRLIDFADSPDFDDNGARVNAARALAEVEGYREAGVERLIDLIDNPNLHASTRVNAARTLPLAEADA
ncbi:helix-turn-helix domain-containing protein [Kitasatospora sp. NPDC096140]|uniref:helix-turn-helix domain-containing protein n=1 Tax=Kitasatospora sp. NPDC096140 TaxID=3155425 RepID=UPI00331FBA5C